MILVNNKKGENQGEKWQLDQKKPKKGHVAALLWTPLFIFPLDLLMLYSANLAELIILYFIYYHSRHPGSLNSFTKYVFSKGLFFQDCS